MLITIYYLVDFMSIYLRYVEDIIHLILRHEVLLPTDVDYMLIYYSRMCVLSESRYNDNIFALLAQLVERLFCKQKVFSSILK